MVGTAVTPRLSLCQEYRVRDPSLLIACERLAAMSALPPKMEFGTQSLNVRFVPTADIARRRRPVQCQPGLSSCIVGA